MKKENDIFEESEAPARKSGDLKQLKKHAWPDMTNYTNLLDINDFVAKEYCENDVYPRHNFPFRRNTYADCAAYLLRIPKDGIQNLKVLLKRNLITVQWDIDQDHFTRRILVGAEIDLTKLKVLWRNNDVVDWSDIKTQLYIVLPYNLEFKKGVEIEIPVEEFKEKV